MRRWAWIAWLLIASLSWAACTGPAAGSTRVARILTGAPTTLDPAAQGDAGSAAVTAQLFESLTTFDADRQTRPALAESWRIEDGGKRIVFHMRAGLTFSDGTPLQASDVVRSWLRIIDPKAPSPLTSLMLVVDGASDYVTGVAADPASVGLAADDTTDDVTVTLTRPSAEFVDVVASPTFAIVPKGVSDGTAAALEPGPDFVGSGGYVLAGTTATGLTLKANAHYWAGTPAIDTIELVGDLGGKSPVEVFDAGDLDYTPIGDYDASWIAYDKGLGPQLLEVPSLSVEYYGFDVKQAPFDDIRVRQAFGMAIDWRRIAALASTSGADVVATSMVPPGIPGRSETDFLPKHDPGAARALLAEAGYPGGAGFPTVTFMTGGGTGDRGILADVKRELGIDLSYETMGPGYFDRLHSDPPAMWSLGWVADYPGRNDFLGILLGTGSSNNYGHYSSADFDAAIAAAGAATDDATASAAYDQAETIVQRDVPVVPLTYGTGWALSRTGLVGAGQNGLGILRMAGLAWAD
jgi:oligopeptide transport system substrate-binding protein